MPLTEADGRQLAADMLKEMERIGFDELALDGAQYREGRPQNDVLARYLAAARGSADIERGFLAVLTDVLGSAAEHDGGAYFHRLEARHGRRST